MHKSQKTDKKMPNTNKNVDENDDITDQDARRHFITNQGDIG